MRKVVVVIQLTTPKKIPVACDTGRKASMKV